MKLTYCTLPTGGRVPTGREGANGGGREGTYKGEERYLQGGGRVPTGEGGGEDTRVLIK